MLSIIFSVLWTFSVYYLGYYFGYTNGVEETKINIRNEESISTDEMH